VDYGWLPGECDQAGRWVMSAPRPEPTPKYLREGLPEIGLAPRDIALLNELDELRLAVDRLAAMVEQSGRRVANAIGALVEQGDYR